MNADPKPCRKLTPTANHIIFLLSTITNILKWWPAQGESARLLRAVCADLLFEANYFHYPVHTVGTGIGEGISGNLWKMPLRRKHRTQFWRLCPWDWTGQKCAASMLILDICQDFQDQKMQPMVVTEFPQMVRYWTDFTVESTPCWSDIEQILQ